MRQGSSYDYGSRAQAAGNSRNNSRAEYRSYGQTSSSSSSNRDQPANPSGSRRGDQCEENPQERPNITGRFVRRNHGTVGRTSNSRYIRDRGGYVVLMVRREFIEGLLQGRMGCVRAVGSSG